MDPNVPERAFRGDRRESEGIVWRRERVELRDAKRKEESEGE